MHESSRPLPTSAAVRILARTAAAFTAILAALALTAGPAAAHAALASSDPADGARIDTAPAQVNLTFNEAIQSTFAALTVVGPDGQHYERSEPKTQGKILSTDLTGLGPAGVYTVGFRVVSEDGHPIQGSYTFDLTKAASTTPSNSGTPEPATTQPAAAEGDEPNGFPMWIWAVAIVVLLAGGLAVVLGATRRKS
ncbi:hypothetical protein NN3_19940 [Nocardia neocaledoniensis NBRC 108232]|uniref:CopC domain-containing protein n=1 Tax=Nocardia neocaledoniensis TaxID=236511 RepID=A0A317N2L7_9NOCA|nr:copper resistance CopC family protein [Nocardia neocaledoniensis]PWV67793.1 hypothetical protein DFR69_119107 [Nocardia neocaledoniensis]GEM30987.1 hypothetical protein NN3_19940 [Nocardia neocaledoniensis NBRC 108232]